MLATILTFTITSFARLLTGAKALWLGCEPTTTQRIYFANHCSHGDGVLLWAALPPSLRQQTRPVAGADYWLAGSIRRFMINNVFRGVLIERHRRTSQSNPLAPALQALAAGDSLILFPEGTRNCGDKPLLPFKSGLYHLADAAPNVELIPVWLSNLGRVMPKGRTLPLPLLCTVHFGSPLLRIPAETKGDFLARAEAALLALAPEEK